MNVSKKKKLKLVKALSLALTTSGVVEGKLTRFLFFLQMLRLLAEIISIGKEDEANIPANGSILGRLEGQDMLIGRASSNIFIGGLDGASFSSEAVFDQLLSKF